MSSTVKAYDVRIVPPGDAALASYIVREVIAEWNGRHAWEDEHVFVPRPDGYEADTPSDLLIAFHCPSRATPGCAVAERVVREIDAHLAAGRPVFVYCSDALENLHTPHAPEPCHAPELAAFEAKYQSRVTVASFGDEKEFRSLFARQLAETISSHPYFSGASAAASSQAAAPSAPVLSELARRLLIEACNDPEAYVGRVQNGAELKLQANGKQLVEPGNCAAWAQAFDELMASSYLRDAGMGGRLFQISTEGFAFLKSIGVKPVGYIPELGSM